MRSEDFNKEKERLRERMSKIKHKIVVLRS